MNNNKHVINIPPIFCNIVGETLQIMKNLVTDTFETSSGKKLEITFIVHASLKFKFGDRVIYVDPTSTLFDFAGCEKADFILFTHQHSDHFDLTALDELSTPDTTIVCTKAVAAEIPDRGSRDIEIMANGDSLNFRKGFSVEAVPAYNYLMREHFHPTGRDNGYILTFDGLKVYVSGDTEDVPAIHRLAGTGIDIAFLPVNQPFTMTVRQAVNAAKIIKPRIFYPYHYGQVEEVTDLQQLCADLEGSGIEVRLREMP